MEMVSRLAFDNLRLVATTEARHHMFQVPVIAPHFLCAYFLLFERRFRFYNKVLFYYVVSSKFDRLSG